MLLTLLTYSYAIGNYASEDIEWDCHHDAGTRYLCADTRLEEDTLRAFRRANRPWIELCLAWVLGRIRQGHLLGTQSSELKPPNLDVPPEAFCLGLARRRLEMATMMDMAMND